VWYDGANSGTGYYGSIIVNLKKSGKNGLEERSLFRQDFQEFLRWQKKSRS
jgi:hypothetical protein